MEKYLEDWKAHCIKNSLININSIGFCFGIKILLNDISTNITSTVKIYADDTKIYRTINEPDKHISALSVTWIDYNKWLG